MANINKLKISGTTYNIQDENATKTVELSQAQYDALVTGGTVDPNTFYIITDAAAGDLSNYYTKSETSGATEISTALASKADKATTYTKTEVDNAITAATSTKQDTLVSGTNVKTINNESILGSGNIEIQGGGGKAIEAGRGISITTGETADTVSFNLPISAGTGSNSLKLNEGSIASGAKSIAGGQGCQATREGAIALGQISQASGQWAVSIGNMCQAYGKYSTAFGSTNYSYGEGNFAEGCYNKAGQDQYNNQKGTHAEGYNTEARGEGSHTEGRYTKTLNNGEHASGQYNNSVSGSSTFGDSGNTLFSVGNGTADNARHNAFEIRQNGDIYLTLDGQDVKLQDKLGGSSITVDTALDSGSTNPVENRVIYNKFDEVEQVTAAALNNINGRLSEDEEVTAAGLNALNDNFGGLKLMKISQTDYDNLQVKNQNTLYIIVN